MGQGNKKEHAESRPEYDELEEWVRQKVQGFIQDTEKLAQRAKDLHVKIDKMMWDIKKPPPPSDGNIIESGGAHKKKKDEEKKDK